MSNNTSMVTSSVITATSQHKRDVAERIRRLYANLTKILALVKGSNLDSFGKPAYSGKGMLPKKAVKRMDPEHFVYTPIDILYLATGGSATYVDIADTTGFQVDDIIVNTTTAEVAVVYELTSGTRLTITAVTGGTWSANAGDYIAMMASTFEEGTSRYANITNELTQVKTYLQIFREGISIADTVKNTPQYTSEGMLERYMTDKTMQALRKLESSMCFSKQGTSGTTSVTIASTAYTLYSMKGLLSWAGTAFPFNGGFNWETFNTVLYPIMPKTLSTDETVYMLCGRKIAATMNQWAANSYLTMGSNADSDQRFGKKIKTYIMGGQLEIEPLVHDLFDTGGFQNDAIFFQNSDLEYLFMEGMDLNVRENAQLPATMGKTDIIEGVVGLRSYSNGANVKWVSGLLAA